MELSPTVIDFLQGVHFAVVATVNRDGLPHQTVMWYAYEDGLLLLNTPSGSVKHRNLKATPRLSVCIEEGYRYVTLTGTVVMDEDPAVAGADYERLGRRYAGTFATFSPPQGERPAILSHDRVTLHMTIESVQGSVR